MLSLIITSHTYHFWALIIATIQWVSNLHRFSIILIATLQHRMQFSLGRWKKCMSIRLINSSRSNSWYSSKDSNWGLPDHIVSWFWCFHNSVCREFNKITSMTAICKPEHSVSVCCFSFYSFLLVLYIICIASLWERYCHLYCTDEENEALKR